MVLADLRHSVAVVHWLQNAGLVCYVCSCLEEDRSETSGSPETFCLGGQQWAHREAVSGSARLCVALM